VRGEDVDLAERRVAPAGSYATVIQEGADFVAAFLHDLKPLAVDGSRFAATLMEPCVNCGIVLGGAVESEQLAFIGAGSQ
jgi:hypothetical protein